MKKKIYKLLTVLLTIIVSINNVYALKVTEADDTVIQEGTYDSARFVAGNEITNKATIDGLSLIAGNDLTLEGNVTYGIYAGNTILVNEKIEKDLFVAGNSITIDTDSNIGRDVYIAGNKVKIKTNIARDLRVGAQSVDLSGITINGDAYIASDRIILDENTVITGKLTYQKDAKITNLDVAKMGSIKKLETKEKVIKKSFKDNVYDFIISYCASLVTTIVLFFMIPSLKEKLNKVELNVEKIAKTTGVGALILIVTPLVLLIAIFSGILTPISLITLVLYISSIYVSTLLVGYIIGNIIISKYAVKSNNTYLSLASGILLIKLIKLIPVAGSIISAIVLLYGLGIIFSLIKPKK